MKCLVIHGSPRRGNTWDVLKLTEEEMNKITGGVALPGLF